MCIYIYVYIYMCIYIYMHKRLTWIYNTFKGLPKLRIIFFYVPEIPLPLYCSVANYCWTIFQTKLIDKPIYIYNITPHVRLQTSIICRRENKTISALAILLSIFLRKLHCKAFAIFFSDIMIYFVRYVSVSTSHVRTISYDLVIENRQLGWSPLFVPSSTKSVHIYLCCRIQSFLINAYGSPSIVTKL
jgi:hypothetical protein